VEELPCLCGKRCRPRTRVVRDVDATRSVLQFRQRGRIGGVHLFVSREDGKIAEVTYQEPFDLIFSDPKKFEYGRVERETGVVAPGTNHRVEFSYRLA